jgi:hypothetical protein
MTRKKLNDLVRAIADITGEATSYNEAIKKGKKTYLLLDYVQFYGGYRIVSKSVEKGTEYGALGGNGMEPRLSAKRMGQKLSDFLAGLEMAANVSK